jgi:hypothetical protein
MTARKVGWIMMKLGLKKARVGKKGRRIVVWDESRIIRMAAQYGIFVKRTTHPDKTAETAAMSATASETAAVFPQEFQHNVSQETPAQKPADVLAAPH